MNGVNARGTYLTSQLCIPHLIESAKKGRNPQILMLSPPLDMSQKWFEGHVAYTMAKVRTKKKKKKISKLKSSQIKPTNQNPQTI